MSTRKVAWFKGEPVGCEFAEIDLETDQLTGFRSAERERRDPVGSCPHAMPAG